jgi:hypothetical protein
MEFAMSLSRKMIPLSVLSAFIASLAFGNAYAAGKMKPGLWEMHMQSDEMKNMPQISPEQMEQMKKMGVKMPTMQDGGMAVKVCVSKEMSEQEQPPLAQKQQSGCTPQNMKQSGNEYSMELVCDSPELKGIGMVKGSYNGSDSMRSSYDFKGVSNGKPMTQHMESKGKWLAADCGDVKPAGVMPKK